ncbi:hypothetical protein C427_4364 [Paraglaciecola psychrophila 170]|uniref:Uncharacterized protein n=1 Tax=Paraglaciecola psychrophila 170 TaxID=1129794 RepID=K7A7M9_9ALTE|nr:hypothetical protein C427_4364 [Paraglaciecola psychrophila 170]GAC38302.1 hypothetical protein GPSY_2690 [Paraglaciecola psychrophila 170]
MIVTTTVSGTRAKKQGDIRLSGSIIGYLDFDSFFYRLARPD